RKQLVRLAMEHRGWRQAKAHLEVLHKQKPKNIEIMKLMARAEAGAKDWDKACEWYSKAISQAPHDVGLCGEYVRLLRRRKHEWQADVEMDRLVARNPRSVSARLARARYHRESNRLEQAQEDVRLALEDLRGQDADLVLLAADLADRLGLTTADPARRLDY